MHYYPEEVSRPTGTPLTGESASQNHIANWIDCITQQDPERSD